MKAQVYRISEPADGEPTAVPVPEHYVSHFATCNDPERFSRAKKHAEPHPPAA